MTAPDVALPAPPDGEPAWSVTTLARHLCVPPATAYDALRPLIETRGLLAAFSLEEAQARTFDVAVEDGGGFALPDMYLTEAAVEHLAERFPAGQLARRVLADDPAAAVLLGWDQIYALARHLVEHWGGGAP